MSFNLRQWREFYPAAAAMPLLSVLAADQPASEASRATGAMRATLAGLPAGQRRPALEAHLRAQIAEVMQLDPAQLASATPLGSLGLDSLMGLEIRNRLERSLGLTLSAALVWTYPTLTALTTFLAEALELPADAGAAPSPIDSKTGRESEAARAAVAELSDEEAERMLLQELDQLTDRNHEATP
jgi:acyl carrier protein